MVAPGVLTSHPESQKPLPLPDKPSIAVLPFQNMSGDPEQEYFADGMVEDIITALSRFKSLFVSRRRMTDLNLLRPHLSDQADYFDRGLNRHRDGPRYARPMSASGQKRNSKQCQETALIGHQKAP